MAGAWAGGKELGERSPEVRCPGGLPAAAANVSTLRGRAAHRGKEGGRPRGVGERGTESLHSPTPPPSPRGKAILSACQSPVCPPLSGVGAGTLSPAFSF